MKVEKQCPIVEKIQLNEDAISLTLSVGTMVAETYKNPGQFVHVKCGEGVLLRRPISVCSCGTGEPSDLVRIVFEARGEGTAWLAQRQVGESLDVLGLLGNGFSMKEGGRYLLIGGGIGVPPMLGCAQHTKGDSVAILGFRSKDRTMLEDEFADLCDRVLIASDDGTVGHHGYVDGLAEQVLTQDAAFDGVLACGPKGMLRSVAKVAEAHGVPCFVSMEERMGCGVGACLVCTCDMKDGSRKHVCKSGPVFDAKEVDFNG